MFGRVVYIFDGIPAIGNGNNCDDEGDGGRGLVSDLDRDLLGEVLLLVRMPLVLDRKSNCA